jgi:hypothetical protein
MACRPSFTSQFHRAARISKNVSATRAALHAAPRLSPSDGARPQRVLAPPLEVVRPLSQRIRAGRWW